MMRRVYKRAAIIVVPLALASAFIEPVKLPLGIVAGAVLGAVNFRGLHRNLQNLMGTERPAARLAVLGVFRLLVLFAAIILLAALKAVDLTGLMVGFTVVVVLVVKEGYAESQRETP